MSVGTKRFCRLEKKMSVGKKNVGWKKNLLVGKRIVSWRISPAIPGNGQAFPGMQDQKTAQAEKKRPQALGGRGGGNCRLGKKNCRLINCFVGWKNLCRLETQLVGWTKKIDGWNKFFGLLAQGSPWHLEKFRARNRKTQFSEKRPKREKQNPLQLGPNTQS